MSTNRYYEKHFVKADTLLSTDYFYRITDTVNGGEKNAHNYRNRAFLFYPNGLVLEEDYYTDKPDRDTLYTYTDDLKFARCHGWTVGSYKVSNDTVYFATRSGNMEYWTYYRAKIFKDSIQVFEKIVRNQKDYTNESFPKRTGQVVIKNIRLR